jgi:hypothetical protein
MVHSLNPNNKRLELQKLILGQVRVSMVTTFIHILLKIAKKKTRQLANYSLSLYQIPPTETHDTHSQTLQSGEKEIVI